MKNKTAQPQPAGAAGVDPTTAESFAAIRAEIERGERQRYKIRTGSDGGQRVIDAYNNRFVSHRCYNNVDARAALRRRLDAAMADDGEPAGSLPNWYAAELAERAGDVPAAEQTPATDPAPAAGGALALFARVTVRAISADGWPVDFELTRGANPATVRDWLADHGYRPALADGAAAEPAGAAEDDDVQTFMIDKITASMIDGKTYWYAVGGRFRAHGLAIWPEIFQAAGVDPDGLNPAAPPNLRGWLCSYRAVDETAANGKRRAWRALALTAPGG